ncbi:MAG: hypothetical protein IKV89_03580 [Clostridia bacterium]|nr:hypothetical protein [Clostridia bacterium]
MKMRKITAFILILTIVSLMLPVVGVLGASIGDELIINGGFETVVSGTPYKFNAFGGFGGDYISVETTAANVHSGSNAIKFVTTEGGNPYVGQTVSNLPGGGVAYKYKIGFWYKGTINDSSGFTVKIEQYDQNGHIDDVWAPIQGTVRKWTYFEYEFYANPNTIRMIVMPRLMSTSATVFVDDVTLKLISGPKQFSLDTDRAFYYQEYTHATATLTMDNFYDDTGYTIDVTVTKDGAAVYTKNGLTLTNKKLVHGLELDALEKKTEYILNMSIKDSGGALVETLTRPFCRIDRPTALTREGVYMKNGKPFNPVILYHFSGTNYGEALAGGINVMQWNPLYNLGDMSKVIADLDKMEAAGVMAAVVCYFNMKPAGHADNADNVKKLVTAIKDHPAVFCYMVMDEPFSHFENAEELLYQSYKIIRMIDDTHPVYLCEDQKDKYSVSAKYVDCLGIDPYPGNGDYGRHVANMTEMAVAGTKGEKPVYCILQAFTFKSTTPTAAQLRATAYQAYMAGAKGIGYYPWVPDYEADGYLNKGIYWEGVVSFDQKDKPVFDAYYAHGEMQRFNIYKDENLWYESFTDGECVYTAVLNQAGEEKTADISLVSTNGKISVASGDTTIVNGGELSAVTKGNNGFSVNLSPYQAVLYKTKPEKAIDMTDLDDIAVNGSFEIVTEEAIEGWHLTAGAGMTAPTVGEALKTDETGNKYISLTGETARIEAGLAAQAGRVYMLELDYKTTEENTALVNLETENPYRQEGVYLPSSGGEWATERLIFVLKATDKDRIIVRLRNMKGTSEVCYDNVSLKPLDARDEILIYDSGCN